MNKYELMNREREAPQKKRVAAYCRVSTDGDDQANSFESQRRYFKRYIESNPEWENCGVFADEGISGTTTKNRRGFNEMISRAENGEIDLIITKEISRFARNTLDSIYFTRRLKKLGVGVIFLNDNINTLDGDAELRLAILSSIAQEESRRTSERVKWGQKRRMELGVVFGGDMLGYDVRGGKIYINQDGAKIVRRIFYKFVEEQKSARTIARELKDEGVLPRRAKEWQSSVILKILKNEKYCGDLVQKKTYTPDFLSHEKKRNRGQEEFIIIKDHHEPIISREIFERAGEISQARSRNPEGKPKQSRKYGFSGKIKCGLCGKSFVARSKKRKDGSVRVLWRCHTAVKLGENIGCAAPSIRNDDALFIMREVFNKLCLYKKDIIEPIAAAIKKQTGKDIKPAVEAEIFDCGEKFFGRILDKMIVYENHIEVYLNFLPEKLSFDLI